MHIDIRHLTKIYNEQRGLLPASLGIEKAELIAVVGHNGAGKSTLLKMLASWIIPDGGEVLVDGINLKNRLAVVRKIGFVPESPNLFEFFSVEYIGSYRDRIHMPAASICIAGSRYAGFCYS